MIAARSVFFQPVYTTLHHWYIYASAEKLFLRGSLTWTAQDTAAFYHWLDSAGGATTSHSSVCGYLILGLKGRPINHGTICVCSFDYDS